VEIVLEPPERKLPGGELLVKIEDEVSEHFEYRPASIVRVRVVRPKYRRPTPTPGQSPIAIAELPERPIPRSIAGAGLIAHVITQKFADHLPLHRQQEIFKRQGVHLPRSTLANLVQGGTALLGTITEAMWLDAREHAAWLAIDATGVLVLAAEQCRRGHFWVVVTENGHVLFRYTKKHDGTVPLELLAGFRGYMIADASSVYHELYRSEPDIIEVCCWAHARRRFFDALAVDRERAMVGIGFIGLLYDAHQAANHADTGVTDTQRRRTLAEPILAKLYNWIAAERPKLVDESPLAKAMNYLVNQREGLARFLEDGRLRLGRVARWRGGRRLPVASARPFGARASVRLAVAPSPAGSRRTGRAVFPHPALIESITPSRSAVSCPAPSACRGRIACTASRRCTGDIPCLAAYACA
jgi:transposase